MLFALATTTLLATNASIEIHVHVGPEAPAHGVTTATSLPRAIDLLAQRRAAGDSSPARIVLHEGLHEIAAPIAIDAGLAGTELILEAAPGAAPIVSGGRAIQGLEAMADGTWRTVIPEVRDGAWWFEELFIGAAACPPARHPDTGYARVVAAGPDNRTSFTFDPDEVTPDLIDDRSAIVLLHDWSISRTPIARANADTSTIELAASIGCKAPHYAITNFEPHPRFFLEGSPLLVSTPGEWALDRGTGELVYMPRPGERLESTQLTAPIADGLLRIHGSPEAPVTSVHVRGLRFRHMAWNIPSYGYAEGQAAFYERREIPESDGTRDAVPAALDLAWAQGCTISACTVEAVGGTGIAVGAGCVECRVLDSTVRDTAANGVMLGEASGRSVEGRPWWQAAPGQAARANAMEHCLVERVGRRFFGAVGIWIGLAEGTRVARCVVRDVPYTGISVGWQWDETPTPCRGHVVEANDIHDVMRTLSDGGGIYTLGLQPGTVLRGNAIHGVRRNAGRAPSNGIFLDQGTTDLLVEGNVFWDIDTTPLRWHWSYANTVRGNTFVLGEDQAIAWYNRARAEDIRYEDNRSEDAARWTSDADARVTAIRAAAGPR